MVVDWCINKSILIYQTIKTFNSGIKYIKTLLLNILIATRVVLSDRTPTIRPLELMSKDNHSFRINFFWFWNGPNGFMVPAWIELPSIILLWLPLIYIFLCYKLSGINIFIITFYLELISWNNDFRSGL